MSRSEHIEDVSALLYLAPFLLSGLYALALWVQEGISPLLPTSVYLTVTRSPYVFMAGTIAVLGAIILDVSGTEQSKLKQKVSSVGNSLYSVAAMSLVLVFVSALYANGFTDLSGAAADFITGRYGIVFPTMMVVLSYLITAKFSFKALGDRRVMAIVAMLLVPATLYEIGKRNVAVGLAVALLCLIAGAALSLMPEKKEETKKE